MKGRPELPIESQLIFSGCALAIEELLLADVIKEEFKEKAENLLAVYRGFVTEPDLIDSYEDSRRMKLSKWK